MDLMSSDVSQQKTSPNSNPAVNMQLSMDISAQVSQLFLHQHQLNLLTTLTKDLVRALQGLSLSPPGAGSKPPPVPSNPLVVPTPSVSPRLAFPERFEGEPANARASYFSAHSSSTSSHCCTPQIPAPLLSSVHC